MVSVKRSAAYSTVFVIFMSCNVACCLKLARKKDNDQYSYLPTCEIGAVCGSVQMTSRGKTILPLCSCPGYFETCPLDWDMTDSRSVNQGSVQYKHCREASPRQVRECLPDQTAYTMEIFTPFAEEDEDAMKISHKIHCTCPENFQHTQQTENVERTFDGEIKTYSLSCAPYPTCGPDEACKTLSETKAQFMENELCRCSEGFHCPVTGNTKAKSFDFGVGRITQLFCQ